MSQVRPGLLIATVVFAVFAAYAFLAPATYRANALLVVDSASSAAPVSMPEPLEAARRLSEGILDRAVLVQLSSERAATATPDARARAASSVRESLSIDTSDAHVFGISYKDSNRERAQRDCNLLVHHAVERAPIVLLDRSAEHASDRKRQQQTQELAAFLALHPQVAAESPVTAGVSPDKDPALSAFHAEKANLERRILELESGAGSDNPYLDPAQSDLKLLRRRQAEIDAALSARRDALAAKPSAKQLSPELRAEWKRLLDAVTQTNAEPSADLRPALVARVAAEAPLPGGPIDPNRPLLLFFGVVFGGGLGVAFTLVARASQQRRSKSSRPPNPAPSEVATTVYLPAAPPVPSGLGPAVPAPPPRSLGPAIVPIPQRPISSSPAPAPQLQPSTAGFGNTLPMVKEERVEIVKRPSSDPPGGPLRFASTLVLPPAENPSPQEEVTPDPVLASAARAWDDQIRAHEVPGFAVVRPRSEPPGRGANTMPGSAPRPAPPAASALPSERRPVSSNPPPAATIQRTTSRPPNQMKVTQPLGSFLPDGVWNDPSAGLVRSRTPQNAQVAPTGSTPQSGPEASVYSYVSTNPPSRSAPSPLPPPSSEANVVNVQPTLGGWKPEARLVPSSKRSLCEQLYPFAVESCFVLAVVSVSESVDAKSRTAAELALALADSGHPRILLMEGDFQRPTVQRLLQIEMPIRSGFSQQLRDRIQSKQESRWTVIGCSKSLHVLAEGVMRSPGLMLSQQFADCVKELRRYYDFIIIDGPATSLDLDSKALDAAIDGLITVCPENGSDALSSTQNLFGAKRFRLVQPSG